MHNLCQLHLRPSHTCTESRGSHGFCIIFASVISVCAHRCTATSATLLRAVTATLSASCHSHPFCAHICTGTSAFVSPGMLTLCALDQIFETSKVYFAISPSRHAVPTSLAASLGTHSILDTWDCIGGKVYNALWKELQQATNWKWHHPRENLTLWVSHGAAPLRLWCCMLLPVSPYRHTQPEVRWQASLGGHIFAGHTLSLTLPPCSQIPVAPRW